jgi:hypothetical protein
MPSITPKTTAMTCGKLGDVPAGKRKVRSTMQKNQLERKGGTKRAHLTQEPSTEMEDPPYLRN